MKTIKDTFTFSKEVTEEYITELQNTLDKLEDMVLKTGKYIGDNDGLEAPIWEYVDSENNTDIQTLLTLLTYSDIFDKSTLEDINNIIYNKVSEDYEEKFMNRG